MRLRSARCWSASLLVLIGCLSGCAGIFSKSPVFSGWNRNRSAKDREMTSRPHVGIEGHSPASQPAEGKPPIASDQDPATEESSEEEILLTAGTMKSRPVAARLSGVEEYDEDAVEESTGRGLSRSATESRIGGEENRAEGKESGHSLGSLRSLALDAGRLWPGHKADPPEADPKAENTGTVPRIKSFGKGVSDSARSIFPAWKSKPEADVALRDRAKDDHRPLRPVEPASPVNLKSPPLSRLAPADGLREMEIQKLISLLEAEAVPSGANLSPSERQAYLKRQIELRMLYLLSDQPQKAQQAVAGIPPHEQEFWTAIFWGLSNYFDSETVPEEAERMSRALTPFALAQRHLQEAARLEIRQLAFCHRIDAFGAFKRFERDEFAGGQSVLIYAEIRNFHSQAVDDGPFRTSIQSTVELLRTQPGKDDVEVAERIAFPATDDESRSPRTDYYHSYRLDLPARLPAGAYRLRLTVVDGLSQKSAFSIIPLTIHDAAHRE